MSSQKIICLNRRAKFDYTISETYEAGIVLLGSEVKSLRAGMANLRDSFVKIENNEAYIYNMHIHPYEKGSVFNPEPFRTRKLLLHKEQIRRLTGKTKEKGLVLVPLKLYFKRGLTKVEIALAKGKKLYDKRRQIAKKEAQREIERALKEKGSLK